MLIKVNLDSPIEGLSKFTLRYLKNTKYIIHNSDYINCYCKSIQAPAYKKIKLKTTTILENVVILFYLLFFVVENWKK